MAGLAAYEDTMPDLGRQAAPRPQECARSRLRGVEHVADETQNATRSTTSRDMGVASERRIHGDGQERKERDREPPEPDDDPGKAEAGRTTLALGPRVADPREHDADD